MLWSFCMHTGFLSCDFNGENIIWNLNEIQWHLEQEWSQNPILSRDYGIIKTTHDPGQKYAHQGQWITGESDWSVASCSPMDSESAFDH